MSLSGLRPRVLVLAAVLALAFAGLVVRLAHLQIVRAADLQALAERQYSRTLVVPARRGPILDRNGVTLATSTLADALLVQPRSLGDPVRVAARLAPILRLRETDLHRALVDARPGTVLRRALPPDLVTQVLALHEPGLVLAAEPVRLYPNRELAAQVLGFEGTDGGLEGAERAWNEVLAGTPGKVIVGRDALGRELNTQHVLRAPDPGRGLVLTLDANIQNVTEREVDAAWRRTGAKGAMAVVLAPRTGDVLAIALRPTFNPNTFAESPRATWRNRAITDPFEPGSTMKAVLAAAALEEGAVHPDDRIYAENGAITLAGTTIHDWKRYGWLTFAEVLQNSSNVGTIKVGLALGARRYYHYLTAFGFGAPTNVGLSGESRGLLREPSRWSALSLPTMSIGQEISVTALQMTSAFGTIANGGVLMQPRVVQAIVGPDGATVRQFPPRALRRVISAETASTLTRLLVRVVEQGTGHHAAIPGYEVAGKTGTAQKMDPRTRRYSRAPGVLSFVGFAPATDPRFAMLVMLDEPRNEKWGSEAAAPIFAAIGREILRYLEVPPRDTSPVPILTTPAPPSGPTITTAVAGQDDLLAAGLMPDLRGRSLRYALTTLAPLRLAVEVSGRGLVVTQTPEAGQIPAPDAVVRLALAPPR